MVTAEELVKKQKKKDKDKNKIYQKVYARVDKKIEMASQQNYYQCLYEIPEFMLGIPLYNLGECMSYIDEKLKKNGFSTFWKNNTVIIDWEPKE